MTNPATPDKAIPTTATGKSSKVLNSRSQEDKQISPQKTFAFYRENAYLMKVPRILKYSAFSEKWKPFESILRSYIEKHNDRYESMKFQPDNITRMEQFLNETLSERDKGIVRDNIANNGRDYAVKEAFFVEVRRAVETTYRTFQEEYRTEGLKQNFGNEHEYQAWTLNLVDLSEWNKRKKYKRGE